MLRISISCIATAAALAATLHAQTPRDGAAVTAPAGKGTISGVVVTDDASPRPLRRVTVTLTAGDGINLLAITDDAGRYTFRNLPPSRYTLTATRPGYVSGFYSVSKTGRGSNAIVLTEGQQVTNAGIRMQRGAVITGTLTTESGEPAREARVSTFMYAFSPLTGERSLSMVGGPAGIAGVATDDRGVYRIFGLAPGEYVIAATQSSRGPGARQITDAEYQRALKAIRSGATAISGFTAAPQTESTGSAPIFFPGTTTPRDAQLVTVGAGEERRGVDFSILPVPVARIDGTITGVDGQPVGNLPVTVFETGRIPGPLMSAPPVRPTSDSSGRFTIPNVRPGTYALTVRLGGPGAPAASPQLYAMTEVTVDGRDTTVELRLRPGVTVGGRVTFEPGGAEPAPADLSRVRVGLQAIVSPGGAVLGVSPASLDATGAFSLAGVAAGRYQLVVTGTGGAPANPSWFIKSARVRGADTVDSPFEISTDDVAGVEITMTSRPTELSGLMQDAAGQPAPEYFLIAFAQDRARWTPRSTRIQQVRPAADGRFIFRGLPPGDYFLGALTDVQPGEWYDPTFLQQLAASAIRVTLGEGEKKVQDIRVK
jgi:hypothetical protein